MRGMCAKNETVSDNQGSRHFATHFRDVVCRKISLWQQKVKVWAITGRGSRYSPMTSLPATNEKRAFKFRAISRHENEASSRGIPPWRHYISARTRQFIRFSLFAKGANLVDFERSSGCSRLGMWMLRGMQWNLKNLSLDSEVFCLILTKLQRNMALDAGRK